MTASVPCTTESPGVRLVASLVRTIHPPARCTCVISPRPGRSPCRARSPHGRVRATPPRVATRGGESPPDGGRRASLLTPHDAERGFSQCPFPRVEQRRFLSHRRHVGVCHCVRWRVLNHPSAHVCFPPSRPCGRAFEQFPCSWLCWERHRKVCLHALGVFERGSICVDL